MTLSTPKSELTSARMFDRKSNKDVAYWIDSDAAAMDGQPGRNNHVAATRSAAERLLRAHGALGYIDKALDNVADLDVLWTNAEVVEVLEDIRSLLLAGHIVPGSMSPATDRENGSAER